MRRPPARRAGEEARHQHVRSRVRRLVRRPVRTRAPTSCTLRPRLAGRRIFDRPASAACGWREGHGRGSVLSHGLTHTHAHRPGLLIRTPCATLRHPPNHTPAPPRHVVARLLGSGAHSHPWLVLCTRAHRDTVGCCSLRVEHVKFDVPEPQLHLNCAPTTRQASTRRSIAPRPPPRTHALYAAGCRRAHALPGGMRVVAGVERCVACAGRRARMCSPR
jgi:hypothetical protein